MLDWYCTSINFFIFNVIAMAFLLMWSEDEYNYKVGSKEGPENWGNMKPEWKVCGIGKLQSPIDICNKRVQEFPQLGILQRDYKPAPAVLLNRGHDVMVSHQATKDLFITCRYIISDYHTSVCVYVIFITIDR